MSHSALQRLTEIATSKAFFIKSGQYWTISAGQSHAQEAMFAMGTDEGDYTVVTSCSPPQPCVVYEYGSLHKDDRGR
jgi:hypothetical protein